jgi:hypothetical protein
MAGGDLPPPPTFSEAVVDSTTGTGTGELEFVGQEGSVVADTLPNSDGPNMTQGVLDQWAMWLCELPARFPRVPPRVFLWCMESVGAGALRDITVAGGEGFGAWWVVRCWMDEWMGWIADKGGFLDMDLDVAEGTGTGAVHHNGVRSSSSDAMMDAMGDISNNDTLTY